MNARIGGDNGRVPRLSVDDEGVRGTSDLLLTFLQGSRVRGLILEAETNLRGGGVFSEDRAVILGRSSHDVVVKSVDAQVDLADGGLKVLSEVLTAKD